MVAYDVSVNVVLLGGRGPRAATPLGEVESADVKSWIKQAAKTPGRT